jgi:SHS2 domain-containing protein
MQAHWEHFEHLADIGVRGYGDTPAEAFAQAALALTAIVTEPETVRPVDQVAVRCEDEDLEYLFVAWLNALVFEMATRRMLFSRFDVQIEAGVLRATLCGETVDRERHRPVVEVKGATLTELAVHSLPEGGWLAQCIVDV